MKTAVCHVTKRQLPLNQLVLGAAIRRPIFKLIQADYPDFTDESYVAVGNLNVYRKKYLEQLLEKEMGEITVLEKEVLDSIQENELLSTNIESDILENLPLGDRMADRIASFGGSWIFIMAFFGFILLWVLVNVYLLATLPFDPYPFILLNLILSCLAAIQAPIIMMSQNRKEAKDRQRSEYDYKVNLKAELEIRLLHEKIDHLIVHQNQRLLEIQQIQVDLMEDILNHSRK
ncbi:DUF1003 domain-containing protein [Pontibacter sp. JH31]|uniref:DUF1003 domain-containing protein n=1 Tax=Pontibacter aquaedesilientis TaxID=2766980 RepID=A0ABR7XFT7_9BACT|nr:DUF1003 domain-containing protein [Pontibacter aquaedesilientis]MBD1396236.1 DUF1003 domain-containing protein [Pontibacter aquaedesilientis]